MVLCNGEISLNSFKFTPNTNTTVVEKLKAYTNVYCSSGIVRCNFKEKVKLENSEFWVRCVFKNDNIHSLELRNADENFKMSYGDWNEEKFHMKKESHDNWLIHLLGEPNENKVTGIKYLYNWGSIFSFFDIKSGDCGIIINYITIK